MRIWLAKLFLWASSMTSRSTRHYCTCRSMWRPWLNMACTNFGRGWSSIGVCSTANTRNIALLEKLKWRIRFSKFLSICKYPDCSFGVVKIDVIVNNLFVFPPRWFIRHSIWLILQKSIVCSSGQRFLESLQIRYQFTCMWNTVVSRVNHDCWNYADFKQRFFFLSKDWKSAMNSWLIAWHKQIA